MKTENVDCEKKTLQRQQFLINLQLEYLTHKLRSIIYQDETYAKVSLEISEKKKQKIIELGEKFNLKTLFDSGYNSEEFIENCFWNKKGLPNFQYKDNKQKKVQGNYDKWYLLYRGAAVSYKGLLFSVKENNPSKECVKIRNSKFEYTVNYNEINIINKYNLV